MSKMFVIPKGVQLPALVMKYEIVSNDCVLTDMWEKECHISLMFVTGTLLSLKDLMSP